MKYLTELYNYENNSEIVGLTKQLNGFYVTNYFENNNENVLIVTNGLYEANQYFDLISSINENTLLFPMDDFISSVAVAISPDLKIKRLETLNILQKSNKKHIVITNLMGLLRYLPDLKTSKKNFLNLKKGLNISRDELIETLENFGYNKESMVAATGEYAVRGYIVDVFIIENDHPVRIEFFGNEIDSIRVFDENNQLSIKEISEVCCTPYVEIDTVNKSSLLEYMNDPFVFMIEKTQVESGYNKLQTEIIEYNEVNKIDTKHMYLIEELMLNKVISLNTIETSNKKKYFYQSRSIENFNSNFDLLKQFVNKKLIDGKTVIFYLSSKNEIEEVKDNFKSSVLVDEDNLQLNRVNIINKKLDEGFEIFNFVVISEFDIEKVKNREIKYKNTYKIGKKIRSFDQLTVGDYVVHQMHGIGIYKGVITLENRGIKKDYIQILYEDDDKIYVPVEKISTIFKYADKDGDVVRLSCLNSPAWEKTKRTLQKKVHDISLELIKLYAQRANVKGEAFKNNEFEDMFSADFKYEPTDDQVKAFKEVDKDLSNEVPMDRLLCGDVGFGKTEVAFRGMFKAVINNTQVAYLCPTTILSKQQYENALERFKNFPVEIALLNRFTTKKEVNRILEGLIKGSIDVVFGTHRLLSDDIKFKKLGLLIIDEEQRFGVTHKEKIKKYKTDVNVLTLSATPIPRTLKMAMSGLRDLSIIDTAPVNRYPIQTYVMEENDLVIKDAIYKEMARKGQAFILYNNVEGLENKKDELLRLVPEARIITAHGRMTKNELEDVMNDFINYKYDILLCTTIIETGIDIANANTLIIINADRFGLSQLYQIRGRVGRSNKIAYAYLMYNKNKMLNDIAIKRLQAIKEFTELGSGYRIAMRDLSLRGAGDILGSDQAGFVDAVGLDLYMKMVEDEIKKINGEEVEEEDNSNKALINVDTHIDDKYVSDESLKIEIHQKINEIDSFEKLVQIQKELEDRFGKIDEKIKVYMYEEWFEKLAQDLNITKVFQNDSMIEIELNSDLVHNLKFDKLFIQAYNISRNFKFRSMLNKVYITLNINNLSKHFVYYLVDLLNLIKDEIEKLKKI